MRAARAGCSAIPTPPVERDLAAYTNDTWWAVVDAAEAEACGHPVGTALVDMDAEARHALGRQRSRDVDVSDLLRGVRQRVDGISDAHVKGYLQGISSRLETLVQGRRATCTARAATCPTSATSFRPTAGLRYWRAATKLDVASKSFLLGWAGWQIHAAAVRAHKQRTQPPANVLQLVFEEANKVLGSGPAPSMHLDAVQGAGVGDQWEAMWRDSRKYDVLLHCIAQTPSELPKGIVSSSNNTMVFQLKNPADGRLMMSHLHREPYDKQWLPYLAAMPRGEAVCKFG